MAVLYFLPNAKYYPGMADMSVEKLQATIAGIFVYSALEFLSLVYLHVTFKWKLGVLALHQLGFVLEKNWMIIQGLLVAWIVVVLSFTLVHYGAQEQIVWQHVDDLQCRMTANSLRYRVSCVCRQRLQLQVRVDPLALASRGCVGASQSELKPSEQGSRYIALLSLSVAFSYRLCDLRELQISSTSPDYWSISRSTWYWYSFLGVPTSSLVPASW